MISRILHKKRTIIWLSGLGVLACVLLLASSPYSPFERLRVQVFDTFQRLSPRPYGESPVVIVDIDEESISKVGQWPWPRSTMAKLTDRLGDLGAAVIAYDIVFSEPDRTSPARALEQLQLAGAVVSADLDALSVDNDVVFAEAIARNPAITAVLLSPNVKGTAPAPKAGFGYGGVDPSTYLPDTGGALTNLAVLDTAANGIGVMNFRPQFDGIVRRVPLISKSGDQLLPSLAIEALRVAQGASSVLVRGTGASGEADTGEPAVTAVRAGQFTIPTDAEGAIWVYYTKGGGPRVVPAQALLQEPADPQLAEAVAGHIVLIGTSAEGLLDLRATPMFPSVPGVTIHAEVIDQIISGVSISRPDWAPGLEFSTAVLFTILAIVAVPFLPVATNVLWALLLAAIVIVGAWRLFLDYQMLLDPVMTVTALMLAFGASSAARLLVTENQARFVRTAFGRYLSPTLVDKLARNPGELELGGEERELTLLFCDIRDFTSLSEGLDPTELTELLNNFLTPMTDVLLASDATIDKYMGDAIMAFWNAPVHQDEHASKACLAVLRMQQELDKLNEGRERKIRVGIGLNSGPCCVGNLGSNQRFSYSAIGDAVNVAARVESLTKQYGLTNLVADTTIASARGVFALEVDRVRVVGRSEPLTVYTLLDSADADLAENRAPLSDGQSRFLAAYYSGDLTAARSSLDDVRETAPAHLAKLYSVYAERLGTLEQTGFPHDWDGVFVAEEK